LVKIAISPLTEIQTLPAEQARRNNHISKNKIHDNGQHIEQGMHSPSTTPHHNVRPKCY